MIHEHDLVILTVDVPEERLKVGDAGTVVHLYPEGKAVEVEFVTEAGRTLAVVTLLVEQIRPARKDEIPHTSQ